MTTEQSNQLQAIYDRIGLRTTIHKIIFFSGTSFTIPIEYGNSLTIIVTAYSSSGTSYSKKMATITSATNATYEFINEYVSTLSSNLLVSCIYNITITEAFPTFNISQSVNNANVILLS